MHNVSHQVFYLIFVWGFNYCAVFFFCGQQSAAFCLVLLQLHMELIAFFFLAKDGGRIGSLLCNKAILSATTPTLCQRHALDAKRHISQALKKGGVSAALSNKAATKFHLVINEYVQLIQSKRRFIARTNKDTIAIENGGN
uniref:Uncharacterized protein n=1 Tax=Chenopodium quinoa TaxID=63459 RepID=A0A803KML9_CHEQI